MFCFDFTHFITSITFYYFRQQLFGMLIQGVVHNSLLFILVSVTVTFVGYRNDPKFSDRYVWANSADPDQTAPRGAVRVYTVCHYVCIVWTHCSMVEPHSSNSRVITTNILSVRIFRKFTVKLRIHYCP